MDSQYFIHIIESPGADDFLANRQEGHVLQGMLELMGCKAKVYTAVDRNAFGAALERIAEFHATTGTTYRPILHISCHGNPQGITLTSNSTLSWEELAGLIRPLNEAAGGMAVGMSTCYGYAGLAMAKSNDKLPYTILVGPKEKVGWSASAVAFCAYYFQLFQLLQSSSSTWEEFLRVIVNMNAAAGLGPGVYDAAVASDVQRDWQGIERLRQAGRAWEALQQKRMRELAQALRSRHPR